jgi:hypothetical protein
MSMMTRGDAAGLARQLRAVAGAIEDGRQLAPAWRCSAPKP